MAGMRVKRRDAHVSPGHYIPNALVTLNTHDLCTYAGWRSFSDLKMKLSLGLDPEYLWAEEVDRAIAAEMQKWTRAVDAVGLKAAPVPGRG